MDNKITEEGYSFDRIQRVYTAMKADVRRHETLCFELAQKFEAQHTILMEYAENIECLKTYALVTDLHMEAY